jgi:hypothetical protein
MAGFRGGLGSRVSWQFLVVWTVAIFVVWNMIWIRMFSGVLILGPVLPLLGLVTLKSAAPFGPC